MKTGVAVLAAASAAMAAHPHPPAERRGGDVQPVTVSGNAFFQGNNRFYIRGVDYQPGTGSSNPGDPIADTDGCKRDIPYFKQLGLNTIRVYTVDNTKNHDECMNALADAGIYLVLDVNTPKYSLNRAEPKVSYNAEYLNSVFNTVQMFAQYKNTLAFFSGNEVVNSANSTSAAPYVKAVTRDIRNFLKKRGLRKVPTGYSAADVASNRFQMAEYMNCGSDEERSDFFAFNDYSWCDPSSFKQSGWEANTERFKNYGIPLFLSEYGCNTNERKFQEVGALYSEKMTPVYSGGLVYEFTEASNHYGLVKVKNGNDSTLPDFTNLKNAFEKTKNPSGDGGYNKTGGANGCPSKSKDFDVDGNAKLPALPQNAEALMEKGPAKAPGLKGQGSQAAGPDAGSNLKAGSGPSITGSSSSSSTGSSSSDSSKSSKKSAAPLIQVPIVLLAAVFGAALVL